MPRTARVLSLRVADLEVEVSYKTVKHLRLRVVPPSGQVKVSVPLGVPQREVKNFVQTNLAWIRQAQQRLQARNIAPEPLASRKQITLWGRPYRLVILSGARPSARAKDDVIYLTGADEDGLSRAWDEFLRREIAPVTQRLFQLWQPQVGRQASHLRFRRMKTRWGSCNTRTGAITINLALAERDPSALEYVVVHELVHLLERGHGAAFQSHLTRLLPDWAQRRRALRGEP